MSTSPLNDGPHPDVSPGSMQTLVSRPLPPHSDPVTTKRVCFYKSGDPQFTGHRMVINSRTFKTFDALLDALSRKVPLPFGVRTITTPRGTHAVHSLDDVQDGGSYLCSDQKKVKPFNLDEVHKRQVPWNTARPVSAGHQARRELVRQLAKRNQVSTRTGKMSENNAVVRTPKRLTVYKNRDPSTKRVIVLHRRIAPNFEALLDYLSQVMQFPVVKLYTEDGRRIEGLPALILCSGIVVAAGNEPFRIGSNNLQAPSKLQSRISDSLHPAQTETLLEKRIPAGTISRSRNFSLSSERFLVEQINKSLNGNLTEHNRTKNESMETEGSQPMGSDEMETCDCIEGVEERNYPIMPTEDDIEKSFRVNEDGSMTVEMKVHLTIKQEEMIHWTTTLSRTSTNSQQRAVCNSEPESGANSLDVTNDSGKESNGPHSLDSKEINTLTNKSVGFIKEDHGSDISSEKPMAIYRKLPTPAPRQRRKEASVENIKTVSETEVQESTVGAYSYIERTAQGELTEGYCVVSRSSSSSTRTMSKPGKSESGEVKQKSHSSFRSSGMAEVLQLQNNGTVGITETVVHIYESQGTCDNYYANTQIDVDNKPGYSKKSLPQCKPGSTDSGPCSSSNDCDVDLTRQTTSSSSQDGGKSNMLSLSSACSTPPKQFNDNPSIHTDDENKTLVENPSKTAEKKILLSAAEIEQDSNEKIIVATKSNTPKSKKSKKSTSDESSGLGKKTKGSSPCASKDLQMTSDTGSEKKTSSAESDKHEHKVARDKNKKTKTVESSQKNRNLTLNSGNQRQSEKELKLKDKTIKDLSYKVNTNECEPQGPKLKKNGLDIQSPAHSAQLLKRIPKQRSMNGVRSKSSKQRQELSESVSLPMLQSSSSSVNQYVENWLKKIEPESVPYEDETDNPEIVPRPVFQIGGDSTEGSEIKSNPEKDSIEEEDPSLEDNADERATAHPPVQIRCEGELLEPQKSIGFCKSMPILRVPSEQEALVRLHKSSENLAPPDPSGTSQSTEVSVRSGIKPVLQQLCLSLQSIKRALSQTHLTPVEKEKSNSLPDFSSQVSSAFGSPSKALLSFLSLMTLRDGISVLYKNESQASNSNDCPEALQVMQSLEKISSIKDEDELKASLTSLQSSTSSKLKRNWRDFQEQNVFGESPPLSPRLSEQEFALEVELEGEMDDQDKQHNFTVEQLLDELNMPEDLHREISSLVEGELKYFNQTDLIKDAENTSEISSKEKENDDGSMSGSLEKAADMEEEKKSVAQDKENDDGSLSGSLEKTADMEEEKESVAQDNATTNDDITNYPKEPESQELHLIHSDSPDSETVEKDPGNEDSGIAVPNQSPEGNGSDLSKTEILEASDNNQKNQENIEENVMFKELETENKSTEESHSLASEQKITDVAGEDVTELSDDQDSITEREERDTDVVEMEDTIENMRETSEESDETEPDDTNAKHSSSGSETDHLPVSDREAVELNEDTVCSTTEDSVQEEADHSDFEEIMREEGDEGGQEKETKSILSEHGSLLSEASETSLPHHDTEGECREQTLSSQDDDQVISPNINNSDEKEVAITEASEDEDIDPNCNNSSPNMEEDAIADTEGRDQTLDSSSQEDDQVISPDINSLDEKEDAIGDTEGENRDQTLESFSQEDDQVISPDINSLDEKEDAIADTEGENRDQTLESSSQEDDQVIPPGINNSDEKEDGITDTEGENRDQTLESSSQEDDQVISPDINNADEKVAAIPEASEDEDPDPNCNNSSPQHGSIDKNSMTPEAEHEVTQQTENYFTEKHDVNEVNQESSEVCEVDPDVEPDSCTISDPEVADEDVIVKKSNTSDSEMCGKVRTVEEASLTDKHSSSPEECDSEMCKVQTVQEASLTDKHSSSPEECDAEEDNYSGLLDSHNNINGDRQSVVHSDTKDSVERESCNSTITSQNQCEKSESLGMEHGYHYLLNPTEISQELLDLINSALLSSTLTVMCDSNGNLRIEPDKSKMKEMFMACQRTDYHYGQKRLPSPNTSDLSDYRPDTSDNGGYHSQDLFSESGEEEAERLRIFREIIKQNSEKGERNHVKENCLMNASTWIASKPSPSLKSSSLASFQETKSAINEPLCPSITASNKSSHDVDSDSVEHMALKGKIDSEEGVLIDKGRWLLKENHLIRNSPPVSMGMYGNGDTTSADTAQDNRSEDSAYPYCENHASPLAVISSSELEDMAKPPTPKCTYFNMSHSSDSDPLLDAQSIKSASSKGDNRRNKELKVSPMGEPSKMWAKKNGSMSSFASVEFKLPDGKVHPQEGLGSGANRSQSQNSRTVQEEETREGRLSLRCGQHCPIL